MLAVILVNNSLANNQAGMRNLTMALKAGIRSQPYSTRLPSEQATCRTRMECLNACSKSKYCQTVTLIASQETCYLFGDRQSDGQLVADQTADRQCTES